MSSLQTFGVTAADIANRVAGLGVGPAFVGPNPDGVTAAIRSAAARVCGHFMAQGVPIPDKEEDAEIFWLNARSAVEALAAARVLGSRNVGGNPSHIARLKEEADGFLRLIVESPRRTGAEPVKPGPHDVQRATGRNRPFVKRFTDLGGGT